MRDEPPAERAPEEVVQVLGCPGAGARVAAEPAARHGHVPPGVEEAEELPGPVDPALEALGERAVEQRPPHVLAQHVVRGGSRLRKYRRASASARSSTGAAGDRERLVRPPQALRATIA